VINVIIVTNTYDVLSKHFTGIELFPFQGNWIPGRLNKSSKSHKKMSCEPKESESSIMILTSQRSFHRSCCLPL
jgi:hypothetical protein